MSPSEQRDLEQARAQLAWILSIGTVKDVRRRVEAAVDILDWLIAGKPDTERAALAQARKELRGEP